MYLVIVPGHDQAASWPLGMGLRRRDWVGLGASLPPPVATPTVCSSTGVHTPDCRLLLLGGSGSLLVCLLPMRRVRAGPRRPHNLPSPRETDGGGGFRNESKRKEFTSGIFVSELAPERCRLAVQQRRLAVRLVGLREQTGVEGPLKQQGKRPLEGPPQG